MDPDTVSKSLVPIFGLKILKFFGADPDPESGTFLTLDPGYVPVMEKFGSGITIPDPQRLPGTES